MQRYVTYILPALLQLPFSVIGIVLVGLATLYAAKSARSAADAARAAERAVETSARLERSRLFVDQPSVPLWPKRTVQLDIYNLGKSPAVLVEWTSDIQEGDLPTIPRYGRPDDLRGTIIQSNASYARTVQLPVHRHQTCFIVCSFIYDDVFGHRHRMGFAFETDATTLRTTRAGGDAYNYDREE